MANNIKGITIELNGETTKLDKAIKETSQNSRSLRNELREVEKQLKFDPKNTELLAQKQKILSESVKETGNKLDILKEAEKQVQEQFKKGEASEAQYRAIQREVINTENELKKLRTEAATSNSALNDVAEAAGKISEKTGALGNALMPVTAGIGALAAGSVASFNEIDGGYDTIITKTGATGETLDSLQHSMDEVFGSIPTDAETAGIAIGEVNTRFGLLGEDLENLSQQFIEFAQINGTDLNSSIDNTDKILKMFGVDASQAGNVLGLLTDTGQKTGLSMDTLYSQLETNGAALKDMGLGITESVNLLGQFETSGVNSSVALAGLRKAQQNAVKDGKSLSQALTETVANIQNAADETEAAQIATELFGKKGGPELAQAIREGRFSVEDLQGSLESYGSTVDDTFNATLDPADQMKTSLNNLKLAGADLAGVGMEMLQPMLEKITGKVKEVTEWFRNLDDGQKQQVIRMLAVAASIAPALLGFSKLSGGISTAAKWLVNLKGKIAGAGGLKAALAGLVSPVTVVIAIIAALAAGFIYLYKTNDAFREKVNSLVETLKTKFGEVKEKIEPLIESIKTGFQNLMQLLQPVFENILEFITAVVSGIVAAAPSILEAVQGVISFITNIVQAFIALFNGDLDGFFSYIKAALESAIGVVTSIIDAAVTFFKTFISEFGDNLKTIFEGIWTAITTIFQAVGTWFSERFQEAYDGIVQIFSSVGEWFAARWADICQVFADVKGWFSEKFTDAWESIKGVFNDWGNFFSGLWDTISSTFTDLGTNIGEAIGGAVKSGINGVIGFIEDTINDAIGIINGAIDLINMIPGVSVGSVGYVGLPRLAKGGVLTRGRAIVAEAGPEVIEMVNGKTIVTPLSGSAKNTPIDRMRGDTNVNVNIEHFHNERQQDIRELTEEIMEIAQDLKDRDDKVYA